ncbi:MULTISPECIES: hypothetical protein [unclassified Mesorhizobium]|uniref:hypothetical protein n=1 Tax=unclassified Mesorhizobium TaxID=325217 RepID=UPI000BB089BB|nr:MULTISPECIES: hypothetical protein [unclassified Mesorhizobium]TGT58610.1 hypothetical protein EN813_031655 [Mesorhizobium sp. M00.F.Ca.ET.170.01.1.1]AZO12076.1 hypothetical protein EJ074_25410 [Mesorhizobium sp. M3A.F.Ca.ET.080.04.2.1]PBB84433.1 hypothetical protein CK216_23605 [Mesorhizobium sp. WSM3876]RWE26264.1 MAG: hypothetical protein EOS41_08135 [Mesorhizobium sp.]RWE32464.1 MAG: hypothetical protein EOS77_14410 [Mesorhizobium sp.]
MSEAMKTTNHEVIRAWIEARGGRPAVLSTSGKGAILRVDFGEAEEALQPIEWDDFFRILDDNNLAFLHQDMTADGATSRFNEFVERE